MNRLDGYNGKYVWFIYICAYLLQCFTSSTHNALYAKCHFDFSTNFFFLVFFFLLRAFEMFLYDSSFYVFISSLWIGTHSIGISSPMCNAEWFMQIRHMQKGSHRQLSHIISIYYIDVICFSFKFYSKWSFKWEVDMADGCTIHIFRNASNSWEF